MCTADPAAALWTTPDRASRWAILLQMVDIVSPDAQVLVRHADLVAQGWSRDEVRAQVRAGNLIPVYRGTYVRATDRSTGSKASRSPGSDRARPIPATPDASRAHELLLIRAVAGRSPGLVVSHRSAALAHGLPVPADARPVVHLTRRADAGARRSSNRHVHAGPVLPDEVVTVCGLAVTAIPRTLVDLARERYGPDALAAADAALHRRLVRPQAVQAGLLAARNRTGIGRPRRLLGLADGRSESFGESALRLAMIEIGLPPPELQVVVRDRAGTSLGRVDFAYPAFGLIIEFDGDVKYGELLPPGQTVREVVIAVRKRERRMLEAAFVVIRMVWSDLRDLDGLARRIREAMTRGRRAVAAGLVSGTMSVRPAITIG